MAISSQSSSKMPRYSQIPIPADALPLQQSVYLKAAPAVGAGISVSVFDMV